MEIIFAENESLKSTQSEIKNANNDISKEFDKYKKTKQTKITEQIDMNIILETTLDNKNCELEKLKGKLYNTLSQLKSKETFATLEYPCTFHDFKDSDILSPLSSSYGPYEHPIWCVWPMWLQKAPIGTVRTLWIPNWLLWTNNDNPIVSFFWPPMSP